MKTSLGTWGGMALLALVAGCMAPAKKIDEVKFPTANWEVPTQAKTIAAPSVAERMPQSAPNPLEDGKLYSIRAQRLPIHLALSQFASLYKLNIVVDRDVEGLITVDLTALPLEKIFEAMLEAQGYSWYWDDGLIRITKVITKTFHVDYLRINRTGSASSSASSTGSGGGGGGGSSGGGGRATLASNDAINFWSELENQIQAILQRGAGDSGGGAAPVMETTTTTDRATNMITSSSRPIPEAVGRAVINRLSGTIQVTASRGRVKQVEEFLNSITAAANRQVYIEAKIVEVTLSDDNALGIDWRQIKVGNVRIIGSTSIANPVGGVNAKAPTAQATWATNNVDAVITALQEQGNVRVVSQPRIRTLNNQAAIVKVGTDRTFFTTTSTVVPSASGVPVVATTNTPTTVTEGLTLAVTPQISANGVITMDVSPSMTRISGVSVSPDGLSNAPEIDIKQASTMVRVRDGETAAIGGLIQEGDSLTTREIPGVGKAPVVGLLFRSTYNGRQRREIVIFLTPYLVDI